MAGSELLFWNTTHSLIPNFISKHAKCFWDLGTVGGNCCSSVVLQLVLTICKHIHILPHMHTKHDRKCNSQPIFISPYSCTHTHTHTYSPTVGCTYHRSCTPRTTRSWPPSTIRFPSWKCPIPIPATSVPISSGSPRLPVRGSTSRVCRLPPRSMYPHRPSSFVTSFSALFSSYKRLLVSRTLASYTRFPSKTRKELSYLSSFINAMIQTVYRREDLWSGPICLGWGERGCSLSCRIMGPSRPSRWKRCLCRIESWWMLKMSLLTTRTPPAPWLGKFVWLALVW